MAPDQKRKPLKQTQVTQSTGALTQPDPTSRQDSHLQVKGPQNTAHSVSTSSRPKPPPRRQGQQRKVAAAPPQFSTPRLSLQWPVSFQAFIPAHLSLHRHLLASLAPQGKAKHHLFPPSHTASRTSRCVFKAPLGSSLSQLHSLKNLREAAS